MRLKKLLVDGAIIGGMTIALIAAAEAFLRIFLPQNVTVNYLAGERFSVPDDVLGVRYVPGSRVRVSNPEYTVEYAVNRDGLRDHKDHPLPKPPGTIRVLLVGDSFTFGIGLNYDQTWPVIVEEHLAQSGRANIDLVKAGMWGMDTRSELILVRLLAEKYDADVVVVGFLVNDLNTTTRYALETEEEPASTAYGDRNRLRVREVSPGARSEWSRIRDAVFVKHSDRRTFHLLTFATRIAMSSDALYARLFLAASYGGIFKLPLVPRFQRKLAIVRSLFEKMSDECRSAGRELIVLSIPQQFQVIHAKQEAKSKAIDIGYYDRYFAEVAEQNGFAWITTLDAFTESRLDPDRLFYRLDGHLRPAGSGIVADVFLKEVVPRIEDAAGKGSLANHRPDPS